MIELTHAGEADLPAICALGSEVNALHAEAWPRGFEVRSMYMGKFLQPCRVA